MQLIYVKVLFCKILRVNPKFEMMAFVVVLTTVVAKWHLLRKASRA